MRKEEILERLAQLKKTRPEAYKEIKSRYEEKWKPIKAKPLMKRRKKRKKLKSFGVRKFLKKKTLARMRLFK